MRGALEKRIGYSFSDPALLDAALTHASAQTARHNNERLEFLGDRVLGLVVADLLFGAFPEEEEGSLAKRHTGLVQQEALVRAAQDLDLSSHLKMSAGEMRSGGQKKDAVLSDALEALIGAVYRDGGYAAARDFVGRFWTPMLQRQTLPPEDAKTRLQEWAQAQSLPLPEYRQTGKYGTEHEPTFEIEVFVEGIGKASAAAPSKRAAEKAAAAKLLEKIDRESTA